MLYATGGLGDARLGEIKQTVLLLVIGDINCCV